MGSRETHCKVASQLTYVPLTLVDLTLNAITSVAPSNAYVLQALSVMHTERVAINHQIA